MPVFTLVSYSRALTPYMTALAELKSKEAISVSVNPELRHLVGVRFRAAARFLEIPVNVSLGTDGNVYCWRTSGSVRRYNKKAKLEKAEPPSRFARIDDADVSPAPIL